MSTLEHRAAAGALQLTVPYAFKDAFREVFKTASWNPTLKVYEVKDTTQNRNKWDKFLALAQPALNAIAQADETEASAEQLYRVAQQLSHALATANKRIETAQKESVAARTMANDMTPLLQAANEKLAAVEADLHAAKHQRDAAVAPVLELYRARDLEQIIDDYIGASWQGFSGKSRCAAAEARLVSLRSAMRRIGYEVSAMNELIGTSLNRPDKLRGAAEALQRSKVTGIKVYAPDED